MIWILFWGLLIYGTGATCCLAQQLKENQELKDKLSETKEVLDHSIELAQNYEDEIRELRRMKDDIQRACNAVDVGSSEDSGTMGSSSKGF